MILRTRSVTLLHFSRSVILYALNTIRLLDLMTARQYPHPKQTNTQHPNHQTNSGECSVAAESIPPLIKEFAGEWENYTAEVGCISKYMYIGGDCAASVAHLNAVMTMRFAIILFSLFYLCFHWSFSL